MILTPILKEQCSVWKISRRKGQNLKNIIYLAVYSKSWQLLPPKCIFLNSLKTPALFSHTIFFNFVCYLLHNIVTSMLILISAALSSLQFSHSVLSDSLQPHEPQHTRPPCPSPTPRVHQNPCPSSRWCHPTISSSLSPSPPALNLSQHQGRLKWVSFWHQGPKYWSLASTSVLPKNTRTDLL